MDWRQCSLLLLVFSSIYVGAWRPRAEKRDLRGRRGVHYHTKRHMLASSTPETKKRSSTPPRNRDIRKKPSGHLTPLQEDDMDNDEIVSVAIGPPPIRPKYDKIHYKQPLKPSADNTTSNFTAMDFIKDLLSQLGRDLLAREVSEDFVFGQYVGTAMKNLTSELRLKMQHEVLELIVKYQKKNRGDVIKTEEKAVNINAIFKDMKIDKKVTNETEDSWPDFTNLAKIVG